MSEAFCLALTFAPSPFSQPFLPLSPNPNPPSHTPRGPRLLDATIYRRLMEDGGVLYGPHFGPHSDTGGFGGRSGSARRVEREIEAHAIMATMQALAEVAMSDDNAGRVQLLKGARTVVTLFGERVWVWRRVLRWQCRTMMQAGCTC